MTKSNTRLYVQFGLKFLTGDFELKGATRSLDIVLPIIVMSATAQGGFKLGRYSTVL